MFSTWCASSCDDAEPRHTRQLAHRGVDGRVSSLSRAAAWPDEEVRNGHRHRGRRRLTEGGRRRAVAQHRSSATPAGLPLAPASAQQVENITFYSIVSALEEAYPFSSYPPGYTPCLSDSYPAPYSYARECVLVCTRRYDPCLGLRINNNNKTMESGAVGLFKLQTQKKNLHVGRWLFVSLAKRKWGNVAGLLSVVLHVVHGLQLVRGAKRSAVPCSHSLPDDPTPSSDEQHPKPACRVAERELARSSGRVAEIERVLAKASVNGVQSLRLPRRRSHAAPAVVLASGSPEIPHRVVTHR